MPDLNPAPLIAARRELDSHIAWLRMMIVRKKADIARLQVEKLDLERQIKEAEKEADGA